MAAKSEASRVEPPERDWQGRTRRRHDEIYATIRTRISLLDYAPGERLSEELLAEEFGVSRTPLRRVLARLESEGLLRSVRGVGTIVTDADVEALAQAYALRMELAGLIGRLDPVRAKKTTLARMRAILRRCDALAARPATRSFAEINISFFHALLELTGNAPLREISERLYFRTARIWIASLHVVDLGEEIETFRRELIDTIAAVELGDLAAVGLIRRSHISMSFMRLRAKERERKATAERSLHDCPHEATPRGDRR